MTMTHYSEKTVDFLWNLRLNNSREWFQEHKAEYEALMLQPTKELANALFEHLRDKYPKHDWKLHISRIYRDARRLYGRGPYKDHLWFTIYEKEQGPAFWFEIGASGYHWGTGMYDVSAEQMEHYRAAIEANPAKAERLAAAIREQDRFQLDGHLYKRPKKQMGELLDPWYNRREIGLSCGENFGGALFDPALPKLLADDYTFLMPYYDFFSTAMEIPVL